VEKALKSSKTLEEFNLAVSRETASNYRHRAEFTKAKERLANGEGLGRGFLSTVLPSSITNSQIQAVAGSVYGEKIQRAKTKLAAAKRKQAAATKDRQEAKRLQQEAKQIEDEARRIGGSAVAHDVMVTLSSPGAMAAFVETIKRERIPKEHHKAAAEHVLKEKIARERIPAALATWWFTRSGREAKMRDKAARELFKKRHSNKTPDSFAIKLITDMKKLDEGVAALTEYVVHVNNKNIRSRLSKQALNTIEKLQRLHQAIDKHDVVFVDFKALTHR
jgi:hypothetical protein